MLGKASEAAWIQTGLALAQALPISSLAEGKKLEKILTDPFSSIGKQITEIVKLYERQDLVKPIVEASGIKLQDLRNAVIWADAVRDSRNSLHYGATPSMSNSYEKVAALLIGAVPHLRILYQIKDAADSITASGPLAAAGN